jgi:hypothetical protein
MDLAISFVWLNLLHCFIHYFFLCIFKKCFLPVLIVFYYYFLIGLVLASDMLNASLYVRGAEVASVTSSRSDLLTVALLASPASGYTQIALQPHDHSDQVATKTAKKKQRHRSVDQSVSFSLVFFVFVFCFLFCLWPSR